MSRTAPIAVTFTRFLRDVLRVRLTPGQRVLCLVAFDGLDPIQLDDGDRQIARCIFGPIDVIPPSARSVIAALIGARSGKSYLFSLRLLHAALTLRLNSLAAGEQAFGLLVAPDLRLARQGLRYIIGACESTPAIKKLISGTTSDSITLRRPDGRVVTIECLPATRGGSAVRGRSLVGAVLDEAAFFRDDDYVINDTELYKAIAPRVMPGGQVVIASTPWAEAGLLFELFTANHGTPSTALAAHAATELLRTDSHTLEIVARERERDPDNARREFDAVPMNAGTGAFFDPVAIRACVAEDVPGTTFPASKYERSWAGLDTGFRKDPSAAVVVRACGLKLETLVVAEVVEIAPPQGGRLVPSETIKELLARAKAHRCEGVIADQHYIESVREFASGFVLTEAPGGLSGKTIAHVVARRAIAEGRVRISAQHTRLISQLREVVSRPTAGGGLTISSPRRGGAHGDLASAFVLACWAAANSCSFENPKITRANESIIGDMYSTPGSNFTREYRGSHPTHDRETGVRLRRRGPGLFD